jgi:hypothetical protein
MDANRKKMVNIIRTGLFILVIIIVGYLVFDALNNFVSQPQTVNLKTFNEPRQISVELKIKVNGELARYVVILLGFLWIILLAEKSEFSKLKIEYPLEILLFVTANICFLFSLTANFVWQNRITAAYWDISVANEGSIKVPDLLCKHLIELSNIQFLFFLIGITLTLLLLVFSRYLANNIYHI